MSLDAKIRQARIMIELVMPKAAKPALMCSFGKDSMVLLHLLRDMGHRLPVIFHRDPWWPNKYSFAERIIREMDLETHDWAPSAITLWEGKSIMAFTNHYQVGPAAGSFLQLPKNILPPESGKKYLCARDDIFGRPTGSFCYPWDLIFIGHKSSDEDQIAGKVPLKVDVKQNPGIAPTAAFPLREWTDADIWDYTERFKVPQQPDRYDLKNRQELPDKTNNSDYAHICIACMDRRNKSQAIRCPKLGLEVSNISHRVRYAEVKADYCGEDLAHAQN